MHVTISFILADGEWQAGCSCSTWLIGSAVNPEALPGACSSRSARALQLLGVAQALSFQTQALRPG